LDVEVLAGFIISSSEMHQHKCNAVLSVIIIYTVMKHCVFASNRLLVQTISIDI
jgi:hypothetical protein